MIRKKRGCLSCHDILSSLTEPFALLDFVCPLGELVFVIMDPAGSGVLGREVFFYRISKNFGGGSNFVFCRFARGFALS